MSVIKNPINHRWTLAARPQGRPKASDFEWQADPLPTAGPGQMLLRTVWLSLDPYMRGRMNDTKSYVPPVQIGATMEGGAVSEVLESQVDGFAPGDLVMAYTGWQEYAVSDGSGVRKVDPSVAPISTALGVLGMPGFTGYVGLLDIGMPKAGETVVVSAASGAVGSVVGQIAKIKGCRVVGVAGAPEKCAFVTGELGYDACVSHHEADLAGALAKACPDGIDVYYENVGGKVFHTVIDQMNVHGRITVCGLIAWYNLTGLPEGPDLTPKVMRAILTRRLKMQGLIIFDHNDRHDAFQAEVSGWIRDGKLKYREDVVEGLAQAPEAFIGLLEGRNFGKLLVRVGQQT